MRAVGEARRSARRAARPAGSRRRSSRIWPSVSNSVSTTIGARPSEGSSSSRTSGRAISARAIASCCCWPPESAPATRCANSPITGKSARDPLAVGGDAVHRAARGEPEPQVLLDGQRGEDVAALGDQRRCRRARGPRAARAARAPCRRISPARQRDEAHDRVQRRRLAGAVGPDQADDLAAAERQAEVAHGGQPAVADLDRVELEDGVSHRGRRRPRRRGRRSRRRGCARISAGVPTASVTPRSSTWMRSQTSMISATLWSISRTPAPKSVWTERIDRGEGRDLGLVQPGGRLVQQHEAGPQRERARDAELALVAVREQAGARSSRAVGEAEQLEQLAGAPARLARRAADAERGDLDVLAHAQRAEQAAVLEGPREPGAAAAVRRPARDVGVAERDLARASGRSKPVSRLTSVVLPAPLGPIRPSTSPGASSRSTSESASTPSNGARDAEGPKRVGPSGVSRVRRRQRAPGVPLISGCSGSSAPCAARGTSPCCC